MSVLTKKIFRDLAEHWLQFLAITLVILCGIAALVTARSAYLSLKTTRDTYYASYFMPHFWFYVDKAPDDAVEWIEKLPGVTRARGRVQFDVPVDLDGVEEPVTGRLISSPLPESEETRRYRTGVCDIRIWKGEYFSGSFKRQVILSRKFAEARDLDVGEQIEATVNDVKQTFLIVGIAQSPEYVYTIRGATDFLPDPKTFGIMWAREDYVEEAFNFEGACNNIVGICGDAAELDRVINKGEKHLKKFGLLYSVKREDQISHRMLSDEIEGQRGSAMIVPMIFLVVASLVLAIMLSRMVHNQRTQIGVMMAFGYSRRYILFHYLIFSLVVAVLGSAGGLGVGYAVAHPITEIYQQFYSFPYLKIVVPSSTIAHSLLFGIGFSLAGGVIAVRSLLKLTPASALHPPPPERGKRVLLERMKELWNALPFRWKMITRNMARHKLRAAFTVFGTAVSAAILILGFFTKNSMDFLIDHQYDKVQKEDMKVHFNNEKDAAACREIGRTSEVKYAEPVLEVPAELEVAWKKKLVMLTGIEEDCRLHRILDAGGERLKPPSSGIMLSSRLAEQLGLKIGDRVRVTPRIGERREKEVVLTGVVEQYLGMAAYMNLEKLSRLVGYRRIATGTLVDVDNSEKEDFNDRLKDIPGVTAVENKKRIEQSFRDTIASSMYVMTMTLTIFAGVIAFSIIFTTTTVSIHERSRELASLRVLGFSVDEVGSIVFNENMLLAVSGIVLGLPLGWLAAFSIIKAFQSDLYRLPLVIEPYTYLVSGIVVFVFVLFSNWMSYRKIRELDMVEVLKTRE